MKNVFLASMIMISSFSAIAADTDKPSSNKIENIGCNLDTFSNDELNNFKLDDFINKINKVPMASKNDSIEYTEGDTNFYVEISQDSDVSVSLIYGFENSATKQQDSLAMSLLKAGKNRDGLNVLQILTQEGKIGYYLTQDFRKALKEYGKLKAPATTNDAIKLGKLLQKYDYQFIIDADIKELAQLSGELIQKGLLKKDSVIMMMMGSQCTHE